MGQTKTSYAVAGPTANEPANARNKGTQANYEFAGSRFIVLHEHHGVHPFSIVSQKPKNYRCRNIDLLQNTGFHNLFALLDILQ
ncbi:MAG: hypothetical protein ACOX1X_04315 [Dethiobacteria bacterium]|jgi:hypothetical protein